MSDDLLERLDAASYSEEQLQKVIDFVWVLDEKHPTLWTGICKTLIITMMRDRADSKRLYLKMAQALYTAQKRHTR